MTTLFISHVEEDSAVAVELATLLEEFGFRTWYYERDSLPGMSYLLQVDKAIDHADAILLVISDKSLNSHQITIEVVRAHEGGKLIMPLLLDVSHAELQKRQPEWRTALGAASSLALSGKQLNRGAEKIVQGLEALDVYPGPHTAGGKAKLLFEMSSEEYKDLVGTADAYCYIFHNLAKTRADSSWNELATEMAYGAFLANPVPETNKERAKRLIMFLIRALGKLDQAIVTQQIHFDSISINPPNPSSAIIEEIELDRLLTYKKDLLNTINNYKTKYSVDDRSE